MSIRKPIAAALMGVLALVLLVALPQARAVASDFLGLFRVQKFAPISVSPQQIAVLSEMGENGIYPGEFEMVREPGEPRTFGTVDEAVTYLMENEQWGYYRRLPTLPTPTYIGVTDGGEARLTVNLEGARQLVEAVGIDPMQLPDSLDNAVISATVNPQLVQEWEGLTYVQMSSPYIDYPADVDPTVIGEGLLRFLGMEEAEAVRLAHNLDWTNTLLLPVPAEVATFQEVLLDETTGVALRPVDGAGAALIWQQNGIVNLLLSDSSNADALIALAETLQ